MLATDMIERLNQAVEVLMNLAPEDVMVNKFMLKAPAQPGHPDEITALGGQVVLGLNMGGNLAATDVLAEVIETRLREADIPYEFFRFEGRRQTDATSLYTFRTENFILELSNFSHFLKHMADTTEASLPLDDNGVEYDPMTITDEQKANLQEHGTLVAPEPEVDDEQ